MPRRAHGTAERFLGTSGGLPAVGRCIDLGTWDAWPHRVGAVQGVTCGLPLSSQ